MNHVHFTRRLLAYNSLITRMDNEFEVLIIVGAPFCFSKTLHTISLCALSFALCVEFSMYTSFLLHTLFLICTPKTRM
jgi:hypothetical protein